MSDSDLDAIAHELYQKEFASVLSGGNQPHLDAQQEWRDLADKHERGEMRVQVPLGSYRFYGSQEHPGLLEREDDQGNIVLGELKNGQFIPVSDDMKTEQPRD